MPELAGSTEELFGEACARLAARDCGAALTAFDRADTDAGDDRCAGGRWTAQMLLGDYEAAHRESDAIRGRGAPDPHRFWTGEPIDGRRVMLRCLHGYGDTVMYLRWLPQLRERAGGVIVQAAPEMLPLLGRMPDAGRVVSWGEAESDWELQVECAELPYLFRATAATLPPPVRIVSGEEEQHRIRSRPGQRERPRVGLVWTGSGYDPARSLPLEVLRPLLADHRFEFCSLQSPENSAEWLRFADRLGWGWRSFFHPDGTHAGIADMAAMAAEMDLVITIDTLAAHVAGSLGVPTWLLLRRAADWRWMMDRDDSPWYPSVRLFRQRREGDWTGVLGDVSARLRDWPVENEER